MQFILFIVSIFRAKVIKLYYLGQNLIKFMAGEKIFSSKYLKEIKRENYGDKIIIDKLLSIYKIDEKSQQITSNRKIKYDLLYSINFMDLMI